MNNDREWNQVYPKPPKWMNELDQALRNARWLGIEIGFAAGIVVSGLIWVIAR